MSFPVLILRTVAGGGGLGNGNGNGKHKFI